jgi:translation initiation factor 6 (eIF-6)
MGRQIRLKLTPSMKRIFEMDNDTLIANYALIYHRRSNLSAKQRELVQRILQSKLDNDKITDEQVVQAVDKVTRYLVNPQLDEQEQNMIIHESSDNK